MSSIEPPNSAMTLTSQNVGNLSRGQVLRLHWITVQRWVDSGRRERAIGGHDEHEGGVGEADRADACGARGLHCEKPPSTRSRAISATSAASPTMASSRPPAVRAAGKRRAESEPSAQGERLSEELSRKPGETMGCFLQR